MSKPLPPGLAKPSDADLERLGIVWVDLAGVTPTGLPYPASSDPVANGAANIQALADAVTADYVHLQAFGLAAQPRGAGVVDRPPRVAAGLTTITFTAGNGMIVIPNGGVPWNQMLYINLVRVGTVTANIPGNTFVTAATSTMGQFYVTMWNLDGGIGGTGAVSVLYFAIGM